LLGQDWLLRRAGGRHRTNTIGVRVGLGLILSLAIGGVAYWRKSLSRSGLLGAVIVGTTVFGFGGWVRGLVLIAFFVSSSLLSHYRDAQKAGLAEKFAKGNRRDLGQTLANGGLAAAIALAIGLTGKDAAIYPVLAFAFYGALAAVNADTWATELGVLARSQPRLLTTGRPVPAGTSGGVTAEGFLAALAGAAFIGAAGFLLIQIAARLTTGAWLLSDWVVIPVAALCGLAGATFDSLLGATVQAIYRCNRCEAETERTVHRCGQPTRLIRGWRWLSNDWVNFLAAGAGATVAALLGMILF
jgi:uncharacterized protein (TIGR00297 family)